MLIGIATSGRKVALRDIKVQDLTFAERTGAVDDNDRMILDDMGTQISHPFSHSHGQSSIHTKSIIDTGLATFIKLLVPRQKQLVAAVYTVHGSCNPKDAAFAGSVEFHIPALLAAYMHVTKLRSGYLFSSAEDCSRRPGAQYVTQAVVNIAKLGGIKFPDDMGDMPRFSAHSLRLTGTTTFASANTLRN